MNEARTKHPCLKAQEAGAVCNPGLASLKLGQTNTPSPPSAPIFSSLALLAVPDGLVESQLRAQAEHTKAAKPKPAPLKWDPILATEQSFGRKTPQPWSVPVDAQEIAYLGGRAVPPLFTLQLC